MALKLYNTASKRKEEFHPLNKGHVGLYVCGVTVYDYSHIGHARTFIFFDVFVRYLRALGLDVTYVRNITDIDDKIIDRSISTGRDIQSLSNEFISAFHEDMEHFGVLRPDKEPKATEHVIEMIDMIKQLIDKEFAYEKDSNVYFSVEKFKGYGSLSGRKLDEMRAGSRIAVDEKKEHPMDFTLWKGAKPGEPHWESPWGPGRPGWHMECSVMSNKYLGSTFDIHGGAKDLLFPHHENERAQSMAANDVEFVKYWVHCGFLTVESEKMSKSLGNFVTIRDALNEYHPEVLRLFLLSKHYRSPLDYSIKDVNSFRSGLTRIYRSLQRLETIIGTESTSHDIQDSEACLKDAQGAFLEEFINIMNDDMNTAGAVGLVFEKVKEMNKLMDRLDQHPDENLKETLNKDRQDLLNVGRILGILGEKPEDFMKSMAKEIADTEEIERIISQRAEARSEKDWARADMLRDKLKEMGVVLEDSPKGTTWRFDV